MRISDWRSDVCSSDLLEGYVENVYVSTRDARDALIDMYDICIETNPYSDAAKQILILAAFINIYNKSRMKPAHIVRWISRWPEGEKAMRDYIEEADRSSSEWNRGSVSRSEEHTSELQSLMRTSRAVFCWNKKTKYTHFYIE